MGLGLSLDDGDAAADSGTCETPATFRDAWMTQRIEAVHKVLCASIEEDVCSDRTALLERKYNEYMDQLPAHDVRANTFNLQLAQTLHLTIQKEMCLSNDNVDEAQRRLERL